MDGYDIHRFSNSKWVLSKLQEQNIEFDDELIEDLNEVKGQNDDEVEWREHLILLKTSQLLFNVVNMIIIIVKT